MRADHRRDSTPAIRLRWYALVAVATALDAWLRFLDFLAKPRRSASCGTPDKG